MAVRREKVVLELEDHLSTGMVKAAGATALLNRSLNDLDGSSTDLAKSTEKTTTSTKDYSLAAAIADEKAARLKRTLRDQARASLDAEEGIGGLRKETAELGSASSRSDHSINQLTGRLRLFADAAAILGPSLIPIGAVAVPAVAGLASQLGFATLGVGSLVLASQGMGDALKAVNEAALEPTAANLEKARVAMEKLGPEAQAFVSRFQEIRPVLADIRDSAAAGWFPGLTEALDHLDVVGPRVGAIFEAIGRSGGNLVAEGAASLAGPQWAEFLTFVEKNAPQALDDLGRTVGNVVKGLASLWMAFDPLNDDFSSWLLDASRSFAEWADGLSQTQGFTDFVDYIRTNGPRVADALAAVANAALQIIEAVAPLGGPSLKIIETFANAVALIADSDMGTPIFGAVAALAAYNRVLAVTVALQAKAGLAAPGTAGGGKGGRGSTLLAAAPVALAAAAGNSLASSAGESHEVDGVNFANASPFNAINAVIQRDADKFIVSDILKSAFGSDEVKQAVSLPAFGLRDAFHKGLDGIDSDAKAAKAEVDRLAKSLLSIDALLSKQGSWDAYQAAIDNMTESVKRNGKTLDSNTAAGRENRASLNGIAESAIRFADTLKGADRIDFLKKARRDFVDGAKKAGGLDARARQILKTLDELAATKAEPEITVKGLPGAISGVAALRREIAGVRDKTVTITVNGKRTKAAVGTQGGVDDLLGASNYAGGYTGPGGKYEPAGLVHRDEVVIPKELVHRDRSMLLARYGHLPGMDQLHSGGLAGYATGGRVGGTSADGARDATDALRGLAREARASKEHLGKLRQESESLRSKRSELSSGIRSGLTSDIWGGSEWSAGGDPSSVLRRDIAEARAFRSATQTLKKKGVSGDALSAILADGDLVHAQQAAGMSRADLREYSRLIKVRASVVASAGRTAGNAAYGPALNQLDHRLAAIEKAIHHSSHRNSDEHDKDRRDRRAGMGAAGRSQSRGYVKP